MKNKEWWIKNRYSLFFHIWIAINCNLEVTLNIEMLCSYIDLNDYLYNEYAVIYILN